MPKLRPLLLLAPLLAPLLAAGADYDLLIRNARVIDGAGNPWFRADVAVKDGRIAALGRLPGAAAARTIDAHQRVVAPGIIDVYTHIEGGIERNPRGDNFLLDGVTTVVTGNCGGSELNLALGFDKLGKLGLGINVATLVGHRSHHRSRQRRQSGRNAGRNLASENRPPPGVGRERPVPGAH